MHHPSFGSSLKWDPAGGIAYAVVGQVKDITGPAITRGDVDVTDQDSADGWREFIPGLPDGGAVTFTIGFDPQNVAHVQTLGAGLIGDFDQSACTIGSWEYTLTTCVGAAVWTFDGYVNGFTLNTPVEGEHTADVGVKITGKPVLTIT